MDVVKGLIVTVILAILVLAVLPTFQTLNTGSAQSLLESQGYTVFASSSEYVKRDGSLSIARSTWDDGTSQTTAASTAATFVVCASNANNTGRCDYVADGTADEAQFNLALAACPAVGCTIVASEGTFNIDAQIRTAGAGKRWPDNVTIRGQGMATTFANRMDGGGINDMYVFDVLGENAGNPVYNIGLFDFQVIGEEHAANTKGQHGAHFNFAEHIRFDNLHFENLSEEGLVLATGLIEAQGGKLSGKDLGSGLVDIGSGARYVSIAQIIGEETGQVEATATVNINSSAGASPQYINIGEILSIHPGNRGVTIHEAQFINIDSITVIGATAGVKTTEGINIDDDGGDTPEDINIGKVLLVDCGTSAENGSFEIWDGNFLTVGQVIIKGAAAHGIAIDAVSYSTFDEIIVHDNTDEGGNAHNAVVIDSNAVDNVFHSITVKDWVFAAANGQGLNVQGDRNVIDGVTVFNADSWDINLMAGADNNFIGEATLSGHGTGGLNNAGAGNTYGHILKGTNGASYEPYQASGTATLLNGNTSITVAHGLAGTPTNVDITFTEDPTNPIGDWWVDTIGAVNFVFNGVDPGASNLDFQWEAKVR